MADWGQVQRGLESGYQIGRSAGGKLSGIGVALSKVAEGIKSTNDENRAMGQKQNLLGYEGLIKGNIAPAQPDDTGKFNVPGIGDVVSNPSMPIFEKDLAGNYVQKGVVPKNSKVVSSKSTDGGKTLISPMIDKISKNEDAYYNLGSALEGLKSNADKFSQFMGPAKQLLRNPVRSYVNKDLQDFLAWKANVQDAFQSYRVAVTGAQASDKEIALLAKNRPTENDTYDVFVKKTAAVRKIGNQVLTRYITNLQRSGYNTSGYQDTLDSLNVELGNFGGSQPTDNNQESQPDIESQYNTLRSRGLSKEEAKKRLGL